MELKRRFKRTLNGTTSVLIAPFMELKHFSAIKRRRLNLVLIAPFMELKQRSDKESKKRDGAF